MNEADEFEWFMNAFRSMSGIDLSKYKRPQMERRLTNLRDRRGFSNFHAYVQALANQPTLFNELLDKMTINVSEFFRNADRWEPLRSLLTSMGHPIRSWSAACSTGEEPYSLAMLMTDASIPYRRILATDIDEHVLEQARQARYERTQLREVKDTFVDRYFTSDGRAYTVKESLRKNVDCQRHNLLADPYPTDLDLIICRNVLIYFTETTKQTILTGFSEALAPGGLLFVGSTEQFLGLHLPKLEAIDSFLYRRIP